MGARATTSIQSDMSVRASPLPPPAPPLPPPLSAPTGRARDYCGYFFFLPSFFLSPLGASAAVPGLAMLSVLWYQSRSSWSTLW